ncbi:MAG TPA: ABC transporter ATP-binding protein [Candidatus Saccharimonadales bacterium]|nr:ABC transporter ATP-binding protein [Candidatus Saccharimonadales bacterium]
MTALVARSLAAGYGARGVLRGIDLALDPGMLVALVGPNGAGKSTLLRALAGLIRPTAGAVTLDGTDVATLSRAALAARIAVVPQTFDTLFPFTVREIVALGRSARLGLFARPTASDAAAVARAIDAQDLGALVDRRLDALSGGERQRVVLAMALAQEADVLLLDEPTAHLDPAHQIGIVRRAAELARSRGVIALAVLHDLNLAALADRVVVLDAGQIVGDGVPGTALTSNLVARVFGSGLAVAQVSGRTVVLPR